MLPTMFVPDMRRLFLKVHRWVGAASGLYIAVVCLSGAALVFRIDLQRARHPHLFEPRAPGPLADPVTVMERVSRAYPGFRLSGVEAPTSRRPTYLAYVTKGSDFVTVLIDPVAVEILGELPADPVVGFIQRLHGDPLGGGGQTVHGIGVACILVMCGTGIVIWWPGRQQWSRGLVVDVSREPKRLVWQIHRALGAWTVAFLAMFAVTGLAMVFPSQFRSVVNAVSPITVSRAPVSAAAPPDTSRARWADVIATARRARPNDHVARVVMPANDRAAFRVMFSHRSPTPSGAALGSVYVDQYSGEVLPVPESGRTAGDVVMAWLTPLHVGGFGGAPLRWLWFVLGVTPALLFASGMTLWLTRASRLVRMHPRE